MTRLYPTDDAYPRGAKKWAAIRAYYAYDRALGEAHPATRAAYGRLLYHLGHVPQRGSTSIEARAWMRESGCIPGFLNRRERRQLRRPS